MPETIKVRVASKESSHCNGYVCFGVVQGPIL
jgi:hypothetical protein